jgi:hypothetical protein
VRLDARAHAAGDVCDAATRASRRANLDASRRCELERRALLPMSALDDERGRDRCET